MARTFRLIPLAAVLLLAGCRSLPDTRPFTDATLGLRNAVTTGGATSIEELKRLKLSTRDQNAELRQKIKDLELNWRTRDSVMLAMVDYAHSIQGIVDAGRQGAESVERLTGAVQTLAGTINGAGLIGGAASTVGDAVRFAGEAAIRAHAARSLEQAMSEIQPAINRVAELLAADARDLAGLAQDAYDQQLFLLDDRFEAELGYQLRLDGARKALRARVATALPAPASEDVSQLEQLDKLDEANLEWRKTYNAERAAIEERRRLTLAMLEEMRAGFGTWAATHASLLDAVRTKRIPSAEELTATAQRIRGIVDRLRNL